MSNINKKLSFHKTTEPKQSCKWNTKQMKFKLTILIENIRFNAEIKSPLTWIWYSLRHFFFFSLACLNICHIIKILLPLYIQITTKKLPSMPRTGFPLVPLTTYLQIRKYKNNDYKHIYKHGHMKLCGNNKLQSGSHLLLKIF